MSLIGVLGFTDFVALFGTVSALFIALYKTNRTSDDKHLENVMNYYTNFIQQLNDRNCHLDEKITKLENRLDIMEVKYEECINKLNSRQKI